MGQQLLKDNGFELDQMQLAADHVWGSTSTLIPRYIRKSAPSTAPRRSTRTTRQQTRLFRPSTRLGSLVSTSHGAVPEALSATKRRTKSGKKSRVSHSICVHATSELTEYQNKARAPSRKRYHPTVHSERSTRLDDESKGRLPLVSNQATFEECSSVHQSGHATPTTTTIATSSKQPKQACPTRCSIIRTRPHRRPTGVRSSPSAERHHHRPR